MIRLRQMRSADERGFALLIVLWAMVFLALLGTDITMIGRSEAQIAANIRGNAAAEAQADGLVYEAIFRMLDQTNRHWATDGVAHDVRLPQGVGEVRIDDLGGRIGLNVAPVQLLQALLQRLVGDPRRAAALAAAIADWRSPNLLPVANGAKAPQYRAAGLSYGPPNAPFRSDDELAYVLGMTPDLLARLRPNISAFQEDSPIPTLATPAVIGAMIDANGSQAPVALAADPGRRLLVAITVTVVRSDGARFRRRAVVRVGAGASASGSRPYQILAWGAGEA